MTSQEKAYTVAFAAYADPNTAKEKLNTLQQMEHEGVIDIMDAGVIVKGKDGKAKITDAAKHARHRDIGAGALIGGVAGLLFPAGVIVGAGAGAIAGGVVGRLRHKETFKNEQMQQAADQMPPGSSAIVAVVEDRWLEQLQAATRGYANLVTQEVDEEAAASVSEMIEKSGGGA